MNPNKPRFQEINCDRNARMIEIKINRFSGGLFTEDGELLAIWGEVNSVELKAMHSEVDQDRVTRQKYAEMVVEDGKRKKP